MKKKGFKQSILSVLLILCIVVSTLYNGDIAKADENSITLDIANGSITLAGMVYTQKNSAGTVMATGTVPDGAELILTGSQTSSYNITVSGSTHPTVRLKNIYTNGYFLGNTATGILNLIIDGKCTFLQYMTQNSSSAGLINLSALNITGENGGTLYQSYGIYYISAGIVTLKDLILDNGTFLYNYIDMNKGLEIYNCTQINGRLSMNAKAGSVASDYIIKNSTFEEANIGTTGSLLIDNVIINNGQFLYPGSYANNFTITGSYIKTGYCKFQTYNNTITNSYIYCSGGVLTLFTSSATTKINGSTLENSATYSSSTTDLTIAGGVYQVFSNDSAFIFKAPLTSSRYRFYMSSQSSATDPVDLSGNTLYLNKVLVPSTSSEQVKVSIDRRGEVNLWTDSEGYLFLYLTKGSHEVAVTDGDGKNYSLEFEGATTRETATNSNIIGTMEETGDPVTITFTPYANTNIEYSFNKTKWYTAATDGNCNFQVIFPNDASLIYLRVNGVIYTADYEDGTITEAIPNIISTSSSPTYFTLGQNGTLFVYAEPVYDGNSLSYQWYKDGTIIAGATNSVLTINNVQNTDFGDYTCKISEEDVGVATSTPITVLNSSENTGELKIISQSGDKSLILGYSTDLFVAGNSDDINYQWYKDGISLDGEENPILHINPTVTGSAIYTCALTKGEETLESNPINVTVEDNPLMDDIADLNEIAEDLTNQVNTLTGQLETATTEKNTLLDTVSDLENQITDLTGQISDLQSQINELVQELQDSNDENDFLSQEIQSLNNQINSLNQQITTLQSDLNSANEQITNLQLTILDLTNDINNLNGQIDLLEEQLSKSEEENSGLRDQVSELQDIIKNLQENVTDLDTQVNTLITEKESLHNQLDLANNTIQSLLNQISELLQENASLQEQLIYAQEQIDELTADLTAEQQKSSNLQIELSEALDDLQEISALLGSPTADKQDIINSITELKNEISSLSSQLQNSNNIINELNEQILNLTNTAAALQNKIDAALDSLSEYEGDELQDKISSIINENKGFSDRVKELEEQNGSLLVQISQVDNTINNLLNQIGDLEEENSNLTEQLNQAEETIDSLQGQLTEQININNELQNQVNDLVSNMNDLQIQLSDANADKEELQYQISNLQSDYNTLTQQLEESNDKIVDLNQQIEDLNTVIKNLQNQIDQALDSLSEYDGNSLKEKIEDVLEKQAGIKKDLVDANNLNSTLNKQLSDATGQLSYLQSEIERLTGVLEDKDAEIARLNALLQQQNSDNATLTTRITDLENENQTLKEENELLKKQIAEGNPDNEEELQQLRDQITVNGKELADANATIEALKNQLANQSSGQSSGSTGTVVNDDEYVVVPQTSTTNNIEEIVKETVISDSDTNAIESNSGWELSSSLTDDAIWGETLQPSQDSSYTGLFSFFDNGLNSSDDQALSNNLIGKSELLSFTVPGIGLQSKNLLSDSTSDNYVKYTFYARKVSDKNKIYVCEVNVVRSDYTTPVTKLSSSIMIDPRNYTPQNTYTTMADGKVVFRATADYGTIGKGSIKYQVVSENEDFDPDGNWTEVSGETFTVPEQKENYRVYIKYTDKAGNFTVDKTVGFNVGTENVSSTEPEKATRSSVPVFEIGKTIELGNFYKINMANVSNDDQITYKSSDKKVATVSKTGVITAKSLGNAVVSGSVKDGDYTYKFKVNVSVVKGVYSSTLNLQQVSTTTSVDGKPVVVIYKLCDQGESIKLNMDTDDAQITYKSSNEKVATVSKEGKVTGKGKGRTNIIVTVIKDGITYTYMVVVRVTDGTDDLEMWNYLTD